MERGRAFLATGQFRAYYCHYPFLEGRQLLPVLQPKTNKVKSGSYLGRFLGQGKVKLPEPNMINRLLDAFESYSHLAFPRILDVLA